MPCKPAAPSRASRYRYVLRGSIPGLIVPGNIDLYRRPSVRNPKGGCSSVFSGTFGLDNGTTILLPYVVRHGGHWIVGNTQQAIQAYRQTGEHLGIFRLESQAEAYSNKLHLQQARIYAGCRC